MINISTYYDINIEEINNFQLNLYKNVRGGGENSGIEKT